MSPHKFVNANLYFSKDLLASFVSLRKTSCLFEKFFLNLLSPLNLEIGRVGISVFFIFIPLSLFLSPLMIP